MGAQVTGIVFHGIRECLTLKSAALKGARRISEGDLSILSDAAIAVQDGKIVWIGPCAQLPRTFQTWTARDLNVRTMTPGWVDAHTHAVFAGSRADEFELRVHGATYEEISKRGGGILSTVRATREASVQELQRAAQAVVDVFVRQGVTTLEIKSGYGLDAATESKMLRVARQLKGPRILTTFLGAHAVPPEFSSVEAYFEDVISVQLPQIAREGLADRVDIFVDRGYFTLDQAKRLAEAAKALGLDFVVHSDQLSRSGSTLHATQLNALSADHVVQVEDSDIQTLAGSVTTAVLLPAADFYIRIPYPKAREMLDAGVRVALATDFNPGSSPSQDLAFVGLLARHEMKMSLAEVIVAFTLGGAYALGLEQSCGSLEVGKQADFCCYAGSWKDLFYQPGGPIPAAVFRDGVSLN
jgi:imidazolonepropionase